MRELARPFCVGDEVFCVTLTLGDLFQVLPFRFAISPFERAKMVTSSTRPSHVLGGRQKSGAQDDDCYFPDN